MDFYRRNHRIGVISESATHLAGYPSPFLGYIPTGLLKTRAPSLFWLGLKCWRPRRGNQPETQPFPPIWAHHLQRGAFPSPPPLHMGNSSLLWPCWTNKTILPTQRPLRTNTEDSKHGSLLVRTNRLTCIKVTRKWLQSLDRISYEFMQYSRRRNDENVSHPFERQMGGPRDCLLSTSRGSEFICTMCVYGCKDPKALDLAL